MGKVYRCPRWTANTGRGVSPVLARLGILRDALQCHHESMSEDGKLRPWREIARELAQAQEPNQVLALSLELNQAIEVQGSGPEVESVTNPLDGKTPERLP